MPLYSTNEFRAGLKVILEGEPCTIVENEFVKPGKGQAFNRVKLKRLRSNRVLDKTFKSGETLEAADIREVSLVYLYTDGQFWHFMDPESFEQLTVGASAIEEAKLWLTDQAVCVVTLWNGQAIGVQPPTFVELEVAETDPGVKGDTAGSGGKPAMLSTGAQIRVPLFVQVGEKVRVDTRTGSYVMRVK